MISVYLSYCYQLHARGYDFALFGWFVHQQNYSESLSFTFKKLHRDVPLDKLSRVSRDLHHILGHFGDGHLDKIGRVSTGRMTQPTVSKH